MSNELRDLQRLARTYGALPSYRALDGATQMASVESLRTILGALGCEVDGSTDLVAARLTRKQWWLERILEPVYVLPRTEDAVVVRLPPRWNDRELHCTLRLEDGSEDGWTVRADRLPVLRKETRDGRTTSSDGFASLKLVCPNAVPLGYHTLRIEVQGERHDSLLIKSPPTVWAPPGAEGRTEWGLFLPLYAAHGERTWGCGDFGDFGELLDWTAEQGGNFVGTLPLLATEWELDLDPSPYAPTSRRFWNELFLDPRRCPEFEHSQRARSLVESAEFRSAIDALNGERLVDYDRLVPLVRRVVERLAETFFASGAARRGELQTWLAENPEADKFARYRAMGEDFGRRWPEWDDESEERELGDTLELDATAYRYHVYAQWQTQLQLAQLAETERSAALYLDFPLGVRRDGYDVWCEPEAFALTVSGGAPPDSFFTKGQNWGFPPLHSWGIREARYRPWIEGIRAHLQYARLLRIDHAMGLHRLYWVPDGADARDGVYVRYNEREFFAILALESHRHEAVLVGENLGTCPPAVNRAMQEHALSGMYVLEFEVDLYHGEGRALNPIPPEAMASLSTHDLPTFSAFWNAHEVDDHVDLGLLDEERAREVRERRAALRWVVTAFLVREGFLGEGVTDELAILEACTRWMIAQGPRYVLVNLEDAWGETEPQNRPGTWRERPNWRRRSGLSLEAIKGDDRVRSLLEAIARSARERNA